REAAARRGAGRTRSGGRVGALAYAGTEASSASSVISGTPARARETGQPAFALAANSWKVASSMPGTTPTVVSAIVVIVGTPSTGRSVTTALVWIESAGVPAWPSWLASAIKKQLACAPAISCSGLAPGPSSKRDLYE